MRKIDLYDREEKQMKLYGLFGHILRVAVMLFLFLVLPYLLVFGMPGKKDDSIDAVTQASIELPDQPSGDFIVLINTSLHKDSIEAWKEFFTDGDFGVIFEDIRCITAEGDATGMELAKRFMAQLPENQMTIRTENPTLLVSKAEAGYIDVVVLSKEMADALKIAPGDAMDGVTVIQVSGGKK